MEEKSYSSEVVDEHQLMQLRQMNSLLYYRISQSSLFSERVEKIVVFQNLAVQPGGTAQVLINSDDFVYGPTSFLKMEFTLTNAATIANAYTIAQVFGQNGSCLQLLNSIRLTHRSGQELEYCPNYLGQLLNIKRWYLYNEAERKQLDALLSQNYVNTLPTVAGNSVTVTAMIPLSLLLGVFNEHDQIIPPQLISGAKLELILNSNAAALAGTGAAPSPYTFSNVNFSLLLDSVRVYDNVRKSLAEETASAAGQGIQFTYETVYQTSVNVNIPDSPNIAAFSLDINKANSILKNVFCVFMLPSDLAANGNGKNKFYNVVKTFQSRLGSLYQPNQSMQLTPYTQSNTGLGTAITSGAFPNSQQAYHHTLECFESQSKQFSSYLNTNTVTIDHFMNTQSDDATVPRYDSGNMSVYGFLMDRAPQGLQYSGPPTNNSRLLNLNGFLAGNASIHDANSIMVAWTHSARVCNMVGDSAIVDQ